MYHNLYFPVTTLKMNMAPTPQGGQDRTWYLFPGSVVLLISTDHTWAYVAKGLGSSSRAERATTGYDRRGAGLARRGTEAWPDLATIQTAVPSCHAFLQVWKLPLVRKGIIFPMARVLFLPFGIRNPNFYHPTERKLDLEIAPEIPFAEMNMCVSHVGFKQNLLLLEIYFFLKT